MYTSEQWRAYYQKNKAAYLRRSNAWRDKNRNKVNAATRARYKADPKSANKKSREWRQKNRTIVAAYYRRKRKDPIQNLLHRTRERIRRALRVTHKQDHSICLLGCSPRIFKQYLEALFLPGMSWANRNLWHIDHKLPISSFDLTTLEGQQAAFHYTNCQPLWAIDNLRKGAKII